MKIKSFILLSLTSLLACKSANTGTNSPVGEYKKAKNIIFLIGDGMGITQISAGMFRNNNQLELEKITVVGIHKPYSSDNLITDSAAGATAFSIGKKTFNGAIGVDKDTNSIVTILEEAESKGLATGMVATSTITHATPGSFIGHVPSRNMQEEIAAQFLLTDIDFFVGGGMDFFNKRKTDERNLIEELQAKGYYMSDIEKESLEQISFDNIQRFGYFTAPGSPEKQTEGRNYLLNASKKAMSFLKKSSNKGFFLMIEGSQIDWGGHANDSEYIITEMIDFDKVIGAAIEFAKADGETLIIITADHETGGYAINPGSSFDTIIPGFTSTYHTGTLIPVFAFGPGAERFSGIYENTDIYHKMRAALGW
jgi:alkaline phosphatase